MKRVPTAEPYAEHENKRGRPFNRTQPKNTDREFTEEAVIQEDAQSRRGV